MKSVKHESGIEVDVGATYIHGIGPGDVDNHCKGRLNPLYEYAKAKNISTMKHHIDED